MGGCGWIDGFMSNNEISNKSGVGVTPEDLWFVMIPPTLGRFMGGWLGQWVGSCQISKNWINWDLIEIIQFCLKVYDLWWHPTYGWIYGWLCGWTFWHFMTFYLNHLSPLQGYLIDTKFVEIGENKFWHKPTHRWGVITYHKYSNIIELSRSDHNVFNFY